MAGLQSMLAPVLHSRGFHGGLYAEDLGLLLGFPLSFISYRSRSDTAAHEVQAICMGRPVATGYRDSDDSADLFRPVIRPMCLRW